MIGDAVIEALGDAAANTIGTLPGSDAPEAAEYASYCHGQRQGRRLPILRQFL